MKTLQTLSYHANPTVEISLFLVVALAEVVPQRLDFPAALLRCLGVAEVLHPLRDLGVDVAVVDEAPQRPLDVLLAPDLDQRQSLFVRPQAGNPFLRRHVDVSVWPEKTKQNRHKKETLPVTAWVCFGPLDTQLYRILYLFRL